MNAIARTAITCVTGLIAFSLLVELARATRDSSGGVGYFAVLALVGLGMTLWTAYLIAAKRAKEQALGLERYQRLTEEYRRLADVAVAAQEHLDLKFGEFGVRLEHLSTQVDSLRRILDEVD
jgi:hypothetical protein